MVVRMGRRLERDHRSWRNCPQLAPCSQTGMPNPPAWIGAATSAAPFPTELWSPRLRNVSAIQWSRPSCPELESPTSKDELQGSLNVPSSSLQSPETQLIIVYAHVSQLLKLWLPLALQTRKQKKLRVGARVQAVKKQPSPKPTPPCWFIPFL